MGPEQLWIGKLPDKPNKPNFFFYKLTRKMPKTPSCNICISLLLWYYNSILISHSNSPNILPTACLWKSFFLFKVAERKSKEASSNHHTRRVCAKNSYSKLSRVTSQRTFTHYSWLSQLKNWKLPGGLYYCFLSESGKMVSFTFYIM